VIIDDGAYEGSLASRKVYLVLRRRNLCFGNGSWKGRGNGELDLVLIFGVCVDGWGIDRWERNWEMIKL